MTVCLCRRQLLFSVVQQLLRVCVSAVVLNNLPSDGINKSSDHGADSNTSAAEERRLPEGELLLQVGGWVGGQQATRGHLTHSVSQTLAEPPHRAQQPLMEARWLCTAGQHLSELSAEWRARFTLETLFKPRSAWSGDPDVGKSVFRAGTFY